MEKINEYGETLEQFLKNYDENKYRRPSNTVDMILFTVYEGNLKVLLVKRKNHPFIGDWAMPGGFIEFEEDMDNKREHWSSLVYIKAKSFSWKEINFRAIDND